MSRKPYFHETYPIPAYCPACDRWRAVSNFPPPSQRDGRCNDCRLHAREKRQ